MSIPSLSRRLALVALCCCAGAAASDDDRIDYAKARGLGIRQLSGRHLELYTDLPSQEGVDTLPAVFDQAVSQWCEFFDVPAERAESWKMRGYVMKDEAKFRSCGMLDPGLPQFANGYSRGDQLWLHEQPTDYYRRHLLLHEGTHGFMNNLLGGCGPPWYMEGVAELLGTHRWHRGRLQLRFFPQDKTQTPHWGRIKIVHEALHRGQAMTLPAILTYSPRAHLENEPYGWCWAAAAFLDRHPSYRDAFRPLRGKVRLSMAEFNREFLEPLRPRWPLLALEWQLYVLNLQYGYDVEREAIDPREAAPLPAEGAQVEVAADRGWQSSGLWLEAGRTYHVSASGRFQVAQQPRPWISEAPGVTIHYVRGRPLGVLLGAVHDDTRPPTGLASLCRPQVIGSEGVIRPADSGALYLRINDSPARRADNAGGLQVKVQPR